MQAWLKAALNYLPQWLSYQIRQNQYPGAVLAVAADGKLVLEQAFGTSDLATDRMLTPRHRFRVASHSKTFTAAGIMKLREQGKLRLDDPAGQYVDGLHADVASVTLAQLLSHSAGLIRDGLDAGQWQGRRPFLSEAELRKALAEPPVYPGSTRFKYSNHGYGLLGLIIEAIVGEPYSDWIAREVVAAAGLKETLPDGPAPARMPMARGHGTVLPLGRRVSMPGDFSIAAVAPAGGFISTAGDLAHFFSSLAPNAKSTLLSPASRREMTRRHWQDGEGPTALHYGLGVMSGGQDDWRWFGHGGVFPGYISHTSVLQAQGLTVSLVTNGADRLAGPWVDGAIRILRTFHDRGAATVRTRDWTGRWWHLWGALDLVPMGDTVLAAQPGQFDPFLDAPEIEIDGPDEGTIVRASGLMSPGESARRKRTRGGKVSEVWLGGTRLQPEARIKAALRKHYEEEVMGRTS